ncbi:MAG: YvrJ family protein [Synergistaceae bacterium]
MEELISSIMQSTFSVAVASYLLVRMDKRMEELTKAVVHLGSVIEAKEARNG